MNGEMAGDHPRSPVLPVRLGLDDELQFHCHTAIARFNACCNNIDIIPTPYDIARLKNRLGITSSEFLDRHTTRVEMDADGLPGVKLDTQGGSKACRFVTERGCGVYQDRPTAFRYSVSMRQTGVSSDEDFYFPVEEDRCLGHYEPKRQRIGAYRREQGADLYDEVNKGWRQIVLKKRSRGTATRTLGSRSLDFFCLCRYAVDGLREFVKSAGFQGAFDIGDPLTQRLQNNKVALLEFGFRLLKQVLFGEVTIALKDDAREARLARRGQAVTASPEAVS